MLPRAQAQGVAAAAAKAGALLSRTASRNLGCRLPAGMAQYGQYGSIWSSSNVVNKVKMAQYSLWYSIWHDMESRFQYGSNMAIQSQYGFNMDQYGSNMESNMVGPKISNMDQYGPIWNQYGSIWKNFQYGSIWTRQFTDGQRFNRTWAGHESKEK